MLCLRFLFTYQNLGKWAGTPVAWIYALFFIYELGRCVGDLKFLLPLTILTETPIWFFTATFLVLVIYTARAGLEVLCRVSGILLPVLILFILLETMLLIVSKSLRFEYLTPIFGEGFQRVAENIWPTCIMQSYGESIDMAVFWFTLSKKERLGRVCLGATLFAGFFIILFDVLSITALGEDVFQAMIIPAFIVMRLVSVADFLENLEVIGSIYFICTIFMKGTVQALAAAICIRELTFASKNNKAIWITAIFGYVVGLTLTSNFSEHLLVGIELIPKYLLLPICLIVPGIVLLLSLFAKAKERRILR